MNAAISPERHRQRRLALAERVAGPILLLGNGERNRNLPMNKLPFRQDSTFLYFTGCALPNAAALLVDGKITLFLPVPDDDDHLWHGPTPSPAAIGAALGVDQVRPIEMLEEALVGMSPATLAVADEQVNAWASDALGLPLRFGKEHGSEALIDAVIALRRVKEADEIAQMRLAAQHTADAFRAVMQATVVGGHEVVLAALFEGVLAARDCTTGYGTILTQAGEVLHNHHHGEPLQDGRLLLLDGGGEVGTGYGVDITRAWPVNGRFSARQRAAYQVVLEAERLAIAQCRVGTRYRAVHDTAALHIARFLRDEGVLRCSPEEALETGAHGLFFPHGVGHLLGMDVHDLENFGDRPSYPAGQGRPLPFGTCYLRLDLPLEAGWVVTIEPGFYAVPGILNSPALRERFAAQVDFERASAWLGLGGIRVEDDVLITHGEPEVLTSAVPSDIAALEALIGSAPGVAGALAR